MVRESRVTRIGTSRSEGSLRGLHQSAGTQSGIAPSTSDDGNTRRRTDPEARFWAKVDRGGQVVREDIGNCWTWTAAVDRQGYGLMKCSTGSIRAHRFARALAGDDIAGRVVRHKCDNPPCVRPDHLVTGTQADNIVERDARGRGPQGSRNGRAVLTESDVIEIRAKAAAMPPFGRNVKLAAEYGVTKAAIEQAVSGRNWRHVTDQAVRQ
jgi:hypothetical protein